MTIERVLASNLDWLMNSRADLNSQQRLARVTGVGQSTIGRIRRAESSATVDNVYRLAKAFGVNASQLLDPRLPTLLGKEADKTAMSQAASIAADIQEAQFTPAQLQILENTVAALKSKP